MFSSIVKELNNDGDCTYTLNSKMAQSIQLWSSMYENKSPWINNETVFGANLPASIAYETAKLVTLEMKSEISGSPMADFLNGVYRQSVLKNIRNFTELGLAKGSLIIKPIASENGMTNQFIQADRFFPMRFDSSGNITKCVFIDRMRKGRSVYTRLEIHTLEKGLLKIENRAFRSFDDANLGNRVNLSEVESWGDLPEQASFSGINKLPFGLFKCPMANQTDSDSPLGVSVYSRAVGAIKEADKRYSNICWEYEATEAAIHIAESMLKYNKENDTYECPQGRKRLYRAVSTEGGVNEKGLLDYYLPQIRDTSLFNGWNNQLRLIEFNCSLAYGTLSNPENVDKTAEEIKSSKQRSYTFIADTQSALQTALEDWAESAWFWAEIYHLAPNGSYNMAFNWDDSIIVDADKERSNDRQDVAMGAMPLWEYRAKWYGEDEETAKAMTTDSNSGVVE